MKKTLLIAGLLVASLSAFADASGMRIGAINWDCSVPASTFFGGYQTRSLGPEKFRDRTPYYATFCGKDRIDYPVRTLAEYETEMRYAIAAGIDYFAYCWYDKTPKEGEHLVSGPLAAADAHTAELTRARTLHLQSDLRGRLGLCAILVCCQPYSDAELRALAEAMKDPAYEHVEGRPLVYLFERPWTNTLSRLKGFCSETVGIAPYVVLMCNGDVPEDDYTNVDAFSAYACVFRTTNYCALAEQSVRNNEARTRHGKPIVPTFTVGWDPTPRNENPVPWCSYAPGPYHPPATSAQLLEASRGFANWVNGRRAVCVPGQVLVFAWNEFEEGGWICPTVDVQGRSSDERTAAFRRAADLIRGEIKVPEGKNDGFEAR